MNKEKDTQQTQTAWWADMFIVHRMKETITVKRVREDKIQRNKGEKGSDKLGTAWRQKY